MAVRARRAASPSALGRPGKTLVEHWNGTSWSIVTSPNPSRLRRRLAEQRVVCEHHELLAVGSYFDGSSGKTLVEHWNGTAWSIVPSPTPRPTTASYTVTCPSAASCFAVGNY